MVVVAAVAAVVLPAVAMLRTILASEVMVLCKPRQLGQQEIEAAATVKAFKTDLVQIKTTS